jgi:hypothetical protein
MGSRLTVKNLNFNDSCGHSMSFVDFSYKPSQKPSIRADAVLALECKSIPSSLLINRQNAKKRAAVAVTRKLAVLLHRLWVSGEVYEPLRNSQKAMRAVA